MSIELVEVEIPFAGIEALEVEVVVGMLPGTGTPDIPATLSPPASPRNGQPWRQLGTQLLFYWQSDESAWVTPVTSNSIPLEVLFFGGEVLFFDGEPLTTTTLNL
jgi:hypothetical protein